MCLKKEKIKDQNKKILFISKKNRIKDDLLRYEVVRQQGKYNMLDPRARNLTGLTEERYSYIIKNYNKLMKKYPNIKKQVKLRLQYIKSANIAKIIATKGCKNCIDIVSNKLDVTIDDLCCECKKKLEQYIYD